MPAIPFLPYSGTVTILPPFPPLPGVVKMVAPGVPPPPYAYTTAEPVILFDKPSVGVVLESEPGPLAPPPGAP